MQNNNPHKIRFRLVSLEPHLLWLISWVAAVLAAILPLEVLVVRAVPLVALRVEILQAGWAECHLIHL